MASGVEIVRLVCGETLLFQGKRFAQASKGQLLEVLKREPGRVFASYVRDDGLLIAVTLPADAVEVAKDARPAASSLVMRVRQAVGERKLLSASTLLPQALAAHPGDAELVALEAKVKRDLADAQYYYETAEKMRARGPKGVIHALSALEDGLKLAADHEKLRALRGEMQGEFTERTSPVVTPAFLATAKVKGSGEELATGRALYVSRCAECHELEMLDSRGPSGWERAVGGMARRAGLSGKEQAQIVSYLTAALAVVGAGDGE